LKLSKFLGLFSAPDTGYNKRFVLSVFLEKHFCSIFPTAIKI
jgi:hypothetical protein